MSRRKKRKNSKKKIFLLLFLVCSLFFIGIGYSMITETFNFGGQANLIYPNVKREFSFASTSQGANLTYTYNNTITNTGTAPSTSWTFYQTVPADANTINCTDMICALNGTVITMTNETYNGVLQINESVYPVLSFVTKDPNYVPEEPPVDPTVDLSPFITVTPVETSNTVTGNRRYITYDVTVSNSNTEYATSHWLFHMNNNNQGTLDSITNASFIDQTAYYEIRNSTGSAVINPGSSIVFTLNISLHRNATWPLTFTNITAGN